MSLEKKPDGRKRSRLVNHLIGLALLTTSVGSTVLLLELFFRLIAPSHAPGTTYGKPVMRNSLDLRDRDFAIPKPAGVYRILMLGDSFTWGVGLNVERALPKVLESRLSAIETGVTIEVVNAAVPEPGAVSRLALGLGGLALAGRRKN